MTTVDVSSTPATVDDGTSAVVHIENTGGADVFLTPGNYRLGTGATTTVYPEGREVTAFTLYDRTSTLTVTVIAGERVEAPDLPSVYVPQLNLGLEGRFGFDIYPATVTAGQLFTADITTGPRYQLTQDGGDGTNDAIDDEWFGIEGDTDSPTNGMTIKKAGWYQLYATAASDDIPADVTARLSVVVTNAQDSISSPWVANVAEVLVPIYCVANDLVTFAIGISAIQEDDVTFNGGVYLRPMGLTP